MQLQQNATCRFLQICSFFSNFLLVFIINKKKLQYYTVCITLLQYDKVLFCEVPAFPVAGVAHLELEFFFINLLTRTTNNVGFTLNWCNLEKMLSLMILPFLLIAVIFTISIQRDLYSQLLLGVAQRRAEHK